MGILADYGPLIDHGTVERHGVTATYEVRGDTHPMIYVYGDDDLGEKTTQLGGMPAATLAGMLLTELIGSKR